MTWWQTLLIAVVPVLVTLVITNWAESRRRREDADQREKEREAQAAQREQERRHAVQDAWRTNKMQAHQDLMFFARRLWHSFVAAGREVQELQRVHTAHGQELTPEIQQPLRRIHDAFRPLDDAPKEMDAILTTVQMFGSDEAQQAAFAFEHKQMTAMLNVHAILAGNGHKEVDGVTFYERWKQDLVPITSFVMNEYPLIVRRDLQPP